MTTRILKYVIVPLLLLSNSWHNLFATTFVLSDTSTYSLFTIDEELFTLSGEPGFLAFEARSESSWGFGNLKVAALVNGNWVLVVDQSLTLDYKVYGPFELDKRATQLKFYTTLGATLTKSFKNILVTRAQYIEVQGELQTFSDYHSILQQQLTVRYSDIQGPISVSSSDDNFLIINPVDAFGSMGGIGSQPVTINFLPLTVGSYSGIITITDGRDTALVTVSGLSSVNVPDDPRSQSIDWDQFFDNVHIGDSILLTAVATSGLPVTYSVNDSAVIKVSNDTLVILSEGLAEVMATQVGDAYYYPAPSVTAYLDTRIANGVSSLVDEQLLVYPNPAKDFFEISSPQVIREIRVVDMSGHCVYQTRNLNAQTITCYTTYFKSGVYVVFVRFDTCFKILKVIILD